MADGEQIVLRLRAAGSVFAEDEAAVIVASATSAEQLEHFVVQRVAGLPLEHIVGWAEFAGLHIQVDAGVFVPRQRTRFLVQQALRRVSPGDIVLDLCCGSGAVGAAMLHTLPSLEMHAVDIDPAAVRSARRNILPPACVYEGDLFSPLPAALTGRIAVLVANAPYVPTAAIGMMPPEARLYEAFVALDGGKDGLDIQRRVAAAASGWLVPGGYLLVESSARQAETSAAIFELNGLVAAIETSAELDATVVIGRAPIGSVR